MTFYFKMSNFQVRFPFPNTSNFTFVVSGQSHDSNHHHDGGGDHTVLYQQDGPQDLLHKDDRRLADLFLQHHHRDDDYSHLHGHVYKKGPQR